MIDILPELYFKDNIIKLVYEFVRSWTLLGGTYYDYEVLVSVLADKAIFRDWGAVGRNSNIGSGFYSDNAHRLSEAAGVEVL